MNTVYGLSSSGDGRIRYIGQTKKTLEIRRIAHVKEAIYTKNNLTHKHKWIRKVISEGHQIQIIVIKLNAVRDIDEKLLIKAYKALGFDLVNSTDGGDNSFDMSPESRKKMSDRRKGKKLSLETRRKLSEIRKGKRISDQTKKKISLSLIGQRCPDEKKLKISKTLKLNSKRRKLIHAHAHVNQLLLAHKRDTQ